MEDETQLLAAWRAGNARAGSRLFDRYYGRLSRFFANKVGDEAYDLIQQTMMICLERHDQLREDTRFAAFLLGIARNVLLHHYRSRARKHDKIDFGVSSIVDLGVGNSTIIAQRRHERVLLEALRRLPLEDQLLLELYYWEDLRGGELAELFGVPLGTLRSRLRRAKQELERTIPKVAGSLGLAEGLGELDIQQWARDTRALLPSS